MHPAEGSVPRAGALRVVAAGSVAALWSVSHTIAFAGLVFSASGGTALGLAVGAALAGHAVVNLVVARGASAPGVASASIGAAAVVHAEAVAALAARLDAVASAGAGPGEAERAGALVIAAAAMTVAAGAVLIVLGRVKAGTLMRLMPSPVVAGFFCGLGIALARAAPLLVTGLPPAALDLGALVAGPAAAQVAATGVIAALLLWLPGRIGQRLTLFGVLAGAILAVHLGRLAAGMDVASAQAAGWLFPEFAHGAALALPPASALRLSL